MLKRDRLPTRLSIRLCVAALGALAACWLALPANAISFRMSSIGYHPQGVKVVVIDDVPAGQELKLTLFDPARRNPKLPVFLGTQVLKLDNVKTFIEKNQHGPATKRLVVDFTEFHEPGTYEIHLEGTEIKSPPIKISEYLYWDTMTPVIKSFYFQRCGQDIEDQPNRIFHAACHLKDARFAAPPTGVVDSDAVDGDLDVVGGWHNGGDFAKYVTSTALAASRLMSLSEWNPKPFKYLRLVYPIFEPGYGTTDDLHHEIAYGLDWLATMQRSDGAVYRKVAGKNWPGKVLPEDDDQPRFIYGVSTQDTAEVAATYAMAARDFKKVDLGRSIKSLLAAEKAWNYLAAHPQMLAERSDSDYSGSGEFLDPAARNDVSYRFWAAAELYVTTGKDKYKQYFYEHLKDIALNRFSWQNPALQGIADYLLYAPNKDPQVAAGLKSAVLAMAGDIAKSVNAGVWPSGLRQYGRSSNQEVVERANVLMLAYKLSGDVQYRQAAARSALYLFGVNPLGITYVTGVPGADKAPAATTGTSVLDAQAPAVKKMVAPPAGATVSHPAHRWMQAMDKPVTGFLVDGPNETPTDGRTPKAQGPASYVDRSDASSSNEPTLLNNAGLAYLLGTLNDAYNVPSPNEPKAQPGELPSVQLPEGPKKQH